jgi:hypothetical protein
MSPSAGALATILAERLTTRLPLAAPLQRIHDACQAATGAGASAVALTTGLFDPTLDPAWLDPLWPATRLILASVATGLGADRDARRELLREVNRLRCRAVDRTRQGPVLSHLETPFAAFHWTMWTRVRRRQPTPYTAVAGLVHLRVRALEYQMLEQADRFGRKLADRLWDYLKSARLLCTYGPPLTSMTTRFRRSLIDECGGLDT